MHRKMPLPRGWKRRVRSALVHILALSHYTFPALLAKAALSKNRQIRLPWASMAASPSSRGSSER